MTVLLAQAMQPNLVQTLENNPAFVHGGPFANIAHGCNSVVATTTALKLADYVVTEAGFGADLGAEKFFDIKCRKAGLKPEAVVIVATVRAMKMNGGVKKDALGTENVDAVKKGCANLGQHIENVKSFGVPAVVAINHFVTDTDAEVAGDQGIRRVPGLGGDPVQALGEGLGRHSRSRAQGRGTGRGRHGGVRADLSRRHAALREDRDDRQEHLPRRRGAGGRQDPRPAQAMGSGRLRPSADLRRQDAVFLHHRPRAARRPARALPARARGAPVGGRGLRRGDLRRDHDDAGLCPACPAPRTYA